MSILFVIYVGITICVFVVSGFISIFGGKNKNILKPFIIAPLWIIFLPIYMIKIKIVYDK